MPKREIPAPIKYPGGKSYLVPKLVELTPKHRVRIEGCCGGAQYTLGIDPADTRFHLSKHRDDRGVSEIINDLDGDLMNFWDALIRPERFKVFKEQAEKTPFSLPIWRQCYQDLYGDEEDQVFDLDHRAWAYFVNCRQSMMGLGDSFAPISTGRLRRGMNEQVSAWLTAVEGLEQVHKRMIKILVESIPVVDLIKKYDKPGVLIYLDPPYPPEVRSDTTLYKVEMDGPGHDLLLKTCLKVEHAQIMLSSYPSDRYNTALKKWRRVLVDVPNSMSKKGSKEIKQEAIYMNFSS